jgi:predicted metal-dependent hydrolase
MLLSSAVVLLRQDGSLFSRKTAREIVEVLFTRYGVAGRLAQLFRGYAKRDHRPEIGHNAAFARAVLG